MITHITKDHAVEVFIHDFSAFASDLGWPPGTVPTKVGTDLGNRQPFLLAKADGEMFVYQQANGCISLTVFND
jgi:hypothetical protein